jgi:hypothetical protein
MVSRRAREGVVSRKPSTAARQGLHESLLRRSDRGSQRRAWEILTNVRVFGVYVYNCVPLFKKVTYSWRTLVSLVTHCYKPEARSYLLSYKIPISAERTIATEIRNHFHCFSNTRMVFNVGHDILIIQLHSVLVLGGHVISCLSLQRSSLRVNK